MELLLWIVAATLATVAFVVVVERLPPRAGVAVFLALTPAAYLLRATGADEASLFSLVKMAAVSVGAAYVVATTFTDWTERPIGRAAGWAILAANILEAAAAEALQGGLLNAAAGALLVLALPPASTIRARRVWGLGEFRFPVGALWVAAYVVWNFTFLYARESHGVRGAYAALAVVHLGAPLFAMRGDSRLFVQYRALALAPVVLLRVVAPPPPWLLPSPHWYDPSVAAALRTLSAALAVAAALRSWRWRDPDEGADG